MIDLEPPSALAASESHLSLDSSFIGKQHWDTRRMFNGANMCTLDDLVDNVDPETVYSDFVLIAEGESGPMFAAKHIATGRLVSRWCEKETVTLQGSTQLVRYLGCHQKDSKDCHTKAEQDTQ